LQTRRFARARGGPAPLSRLRGPAPRRPVYVWHPERRGDPAPSVSVSLGVHMPPGSTCTTSRTGLESRSLDTRRAELRTPPVSVTLTLAYGLTAAPVAFRFRGKPRHTPREDNTETPPPTRQTNDRPQPQQILSENTVRLLSANSMTLLPVTARARWDQSAASNPSPTPSPSPTPASRQGREEPRTRRGGEARATRAPRAARLALLHEQPLSSPPLLHE